MSVQKSKADFHAAIQYVDATDGWDVMVCYAQDPLNHLLQQAWGKSPKFGNVTFKHTETLSKETKLVITRDFNLSLSSPVLQFEASEGHSQAILVMTINGLYTNNLTKDGKPLDKPETVHIARDVYQLRVFLPIAAVSGDTVHKPGNVIELDESKTTEVAMIFHFANEEAVYKMEKKDPKKRDTDDLMDTVTTEIQGWFQSKEHVDWIDISIAKVSNQKPVSGDTETLRPRSFIVRSQPGYLNVFIATKNKPGKPHPRFEHKGSEEIAPVAIGFEASIFISNTLFAQFLAEQFKANFTGVIKSIKPEAIENGARLVIQMGNPPTWGFNIGGIEDYRVPEFSVDYDKYTVTMDVSDNSSLETIPTWSWSPETVATWLLTDKRVPDLITHEWGRTQISGSLQVTGEPCSSIHEDELRINVCLDNATNLPTMRYQPLWVDGFKDGHSPNRDSYPDMFRYRISFSLPSPLKSELKGLNFFSAQNVFIPGVKFIEATTQMMPADIVLLGSMPQSTAIASPTASMVQSSAVKNLALRFMDEIYLNAFFVGDLINATINGESGAVKAVLRQKGYDGLTAHDLEVLRDYTVPGPKFDLRYSGGAYSVESSVYSAKELLVHSVHRTIYIDGTPVESQKTLADGSVSFLSSDGNQSFRITFNAPFDVQNPIGAISYTGTTWVTAQPEHEEPIQGKRAYPWDGSSDIDTTPAASARDAEAFQYLPLALDLITPHVPLESPNVADLASVVGIFSIAVNTVTSLKNIRDFCVWGKEQVMKRTGANMKLRIRGLLTLDKMKQTFPTKAEEAINEILNNSNERKLETVAKAAEPKILEAMKKYMRNEATKQAQKNNGAAYGLSAEDIIHQAHDIADTQATNVFTGEVYASYLNALVDRTVTLKRRNEAFDEKNRLQREINKAGERIRQNRQDLTKKQEELEAKRRLVDKGSIPREKWDDIQREYGREIQKISDKITEDETSTRNDEASRKSHEEAWKKYMKDEAEKKKTEEKRREEFWKHRKDHHTEPKPEHG